jgi:hypothetical protein
VPIGVAARVNEHFTEGVAAIIAHDSSVMNACLKVLCKESGIPVRLMLGIQSSLQGHNGRWLVSKGVLYVRIVC